MWPRRAWQSLYEPRIRAAAGLGRAPTEADPDRYASRYGHCDVLIVGGGPAGLAAAAAAAASGARVMLCDEQNEFGGSLLAADPRAAPAIEGGARIIRERSEEHTSELQSPCNLVCRLLLEKKKTATDRGLSSHV